MARPLFTPDQAQKIRDHYAKHGTTIDEIAEKTGVNPSTISDVIHRQGAYTEGRKRPIKIPNNGPEVLRLWMSCDPPMPLSNIAERVGLNSRQRAHQILRVMQKLVDAGHYKPEDGA